MYEVLGDQYVLTLFFPTRLSSDLLPLLRLADAVIVACVGTAGLKTTPGSELARHLARHDVAVDLVVSPERDGRAGPELLQLAAQHDADLVVMGAYGYMRWRERIFGGATEAVLRQEIGRASCRARVCKEV